MVVSCNDDVKSRGLSLNFLRKDMKGPSTNLARIFHMILFWKHKKITIAFWYLLAQDFLPGLTLWSLFWLLSWNNYKTKWSTSSIQHFSLVSVTSLNPLQPTPPCLKIDENYLVNCQNLTKLIRKKISERKSSATWKYTWRNWLDFLLLFILFHSFVYILESPWW